MRMPTRRLTGVLALCTLLLGVAVPAWAAHDNGNPRGLSALLPNLFGKGGILLAPPLPGDFPHEAHFTVESEAQLTVLNDSLLATLATLPLPSPAAGFTFSFDPAVGALVRSTENFGPIYSQRADTTGRGKLTFGISYSRFTFDKLDGKSLDDGELEVTFQHETTGANLGRGPFVFERDTIKAKIFADITSDVFVVSATYGVLENLDVSIAVPIIHTDIRLKGVATIVKTGTTQPGQNPNLHRFSDGSDTLTVRASDDSTGVGDIVLRAKWNFLRTDPILLATGLDLRLPSGSVDNLRGVGTPVVSPVLIASTRPLMGFSPHASIGFHFSGDTDKVDHEFYWNLGFDWSIFQPVTFVFDILGRRIIDNSRIEAGQLPGGTRISGSTIVDAAIGVKVNVWKNVLGVASVLLPLNSTGLRDKATPLVGLEVSF
jgi:hypothetical protein